MKEDLPRRPEHAKAPEYEALLADVNRQVEALPPPEPALPRLPVVFIVGPPRSGTTLLYQSLASTGAFAYPTNVVARFPARPALGWRIQQLLSPWLPGPTWAFRSRAGRTEGWFQPHEFGYFFERLFPFDEHHQPDAASLAGVDGAAMAALLAELESVARRPVLLKNAALDYVLDYLAETLPTAFFVEIERDRRSVIDSIVRVRVDYYGTDRAWFSVRPADHGSVADLEPAEQVAFQVDSLNDAIAASRGRIGEARWTRLSYRQLCRDPRAAIGAIADRLELDTLDLSHLPGSFTPSRKAPR